MNHKLKQDPLYKRYVHILCRAALSPTPQTNPSDSQQRRHCESWALQECSHFIMWSILTQNPKLLQWSQVEGEGAMQSIEKLGLVCCTGITAMHKGPERGCTRRKHYKVLVSTNELWSRAWKSKWLSRFKNSILVFPNRCFSGKLNLNAMVSLTTQNYSLMYEKMALLIQKHLVLKSCLIPQYICA